MKEKYSRLLVAIAIGLISGNSLADAKCAKSALLGTWDGAITVVNVPTSSSNYSSYCKVTIRNNSTINMVGSCTAVSSNPAINGMKDTLSSADLSVGKDCSVHGTVTSSLGGTTTVYGHLNSAKNVFVASFINTTNGVGMMSLVK